MILLLTESLYWPLNYGYISSRQSNSGFTIKNVSIILIRRKSLEFLKDNYIIVIASYLWSQLTWEGFLLICKLASTQQDNHD